MTAMLGTRIRHSACRWCYHEIPLEELNYPTIMRAIADTGYQGFVGQEFIPKRPDKLASLRQGVQICSV